jgi:hypothetical protein
MIDQDDRRLAVQQFSSSAVQLACCRWPRWCLLKYEDFDSSFFFNLASTKK